MQSSIFPNYSCEYQSEAKTYRESFGFKLPPTGTELELKHMDGLGWYVFWFLCPDLENIVHVSEKSKLIKLATNKGWNIKQ